MKHYKCQGQSLILHPSRVIFWEETASLILSDLHFGKTGHFRKAGIAIPQNVYKEDLQRLVTLIQYFQPRQMIIAGDLFHSHANKELELFKRWREDLSLIDIHLVKGNHDVLVDDWYSKAGITVSDHVWTNAPFLFCHDNDDEQVLPVSKNHYTIAGHIHPGITINGMGRQSLRFPCFYFTASYCVLPAFSRFTGTFGIIPNEGEDVFAIVNNKIIPIG